MTGCIWCGNYHTQRCHVRDRASFQAGDPHDHFNIVLLCATCHDHFFDRGRMGITEDCRLLVLLRCKTFERIEVRPPNYPIFVSTSHICWKNMRAHSYVKARIRGLSASSDYC
jgi:predicted restriction endonuclease